MEELVDDRDDLSEYGSEVSDDDNAEVEDDLDIEECEAAVRGPAMFQDTAVELKSDGRLMLDGVVRLTFTPAQMAKVRQAKVDKCNLRMNVDGYIWGSGEFGMLHRYFTTRNLDADFKEFSDLGCPSPKSNYVVAHWDNILNFLDERNKNIPFVLNHWSRMGKVYQTSNGLYYCKVQVKCHRLLSTANVSSPAKALHARDVLQMRLIPAWARPYFLTLRKSQCAPEFIQTDQTVDSLLDCAKWYPNIHATMKRHVGERFTIIPLSEACLLIKQGERIARRDGTPLGPLYVIVRYTGTGGAIIEFVVSREDYLKYIKNFKGHFHVTRGKICLGNDTLARLVMGLLIGDFDRDALEVLHSPSGKLWNRPCDLRTGTRSDNLRDILKANTHGRGVQESYGKYRAQIHIMCPNLISYVLIAREAAEFLYAALVLNVPKFIRQFKAEGVFDTGMKDQADYQAVRRRIFHAYVEEVRRSTAFLEKFTYKGAIKP